MGKIFFKSDNGLKLCGVWHVPTKPANKSIVMAHGITVDKDENGAFIQLADELCQAGFAVLRFDFSGHGESEGKSVDMTITRERRDLEAAIDEAKKNYSEIGLLGASFGGGTSVLFFNVARNQNKLKCLCLWNPVLNYDHTFLNPTLPWIRERKTHMVKEIQEKGWTTLGSNNFVIGKPLFEEMAILKPYEALKEITIPTVIIHGDKDSKVSYEDSKEYVNYLNNGSLITIKGAEHGFHELSATTQANKETIRFFQANL